MSDDDTSVRIKRDVNSMIEQLQHELAARHPSRRRPSKSDTIARAVRALMDAVRSGRAQATLTGVEP